MNEIRCNAFVCGFQCLEQAEVNCKYCRLHEYEFGPSQVDPPAKPKKESDGKPAFDILFSTPIHKVAAVFTYGAQKYEERLQWRKALDLPNDERLEYIEKLMAAALRHIKEQFDDNACQEKLDKESKLPHLACAVADLMMALDLLDEG